MKKSEFQKLIQENTEKFKCLMLTDATLRSDHPHVALCIVWNTGIGAKTVVKTMRGKITDLRIQEEFNKYIKYLK